MVAYQPLNAKVSPDYFFTAIQLDIILWFPVLQNGMGWDGMVLLYHFPFRSILANKSRHLG